MTKDTVDFDQAVSRALVLARPLCRARDLRLGNTEQANESLLRQLGVTKNTRLYTEQEMLAAAERLWQQFQQHQST